MDKVIIKKKEIKKKGVKLSKKCVLTEPKQTALFMCRLADVQLDSNKCFLSNRMYCLVGIMEFFFQGKF